MVGASLQTVQVRALRLHIQRKVTAIALGSLPHTVLVKHTSYIYSMIFLNACELVYIAAQM